VFTDKASGKDTQRPELDSLLTFVREGDTVVVHSMDRLARNLDDLRRLVQKLTKRGVRIEFVKECLTFTGEDSPMANLMLSVMGAFAEFERALIRERQREGIALAKQRGAYRGRKKALSPEQCAELRQRAERWRAKSEAGPRVRRQPGDPVSILENGSIAMPRRSILSAAERESLLALPDTKDDLIRHYTFSDSDLSSSGSGAGLRTGWASPCSFATCAFPAFSLASISRRSRPC
jgi:hypothetical protein